MDSRCIPGVYQFDLRILDLFKALVFIHADANTHHLFIGCILHCKNDKRQLIQNKIVFDWLSRFLVGTFRSLINEANPHCAIQWLLF